MMTIINESNYNDILVMNLHDFELLDIVSNYNTHKVTLNLLDLENAPVSLLFEGVKFISLEIKEPWGAGVYIYQVNIQNNNIKVLLNSGDSINIEL